MTVYYVDATDGSDASAGTSVGTAWATIGKALGASGISSGDTVHIAPGTYRELVSVAMTSATVETFVYGDTRGEIAWTTPRSGEVIVTAFTTDDKTAATTRCMDLNQRDYLTFERITFHGGNNQSVYATSSAGNDATNITFRDCAFIAAEDPNNLLQIGSNSAGAAAAMSWLFERCLFWGGDGYIWISGTNHGSADYDLDIVFRNCFLQSPANLGVVYLFGPTSGSFYPGGVEFYGCTFLGNKAVTVASSGTWSTSIPCVVEGCVIHASIQGLDANVSGEIVSDYNVIQSGVPFNNVTQGTNDETIWNATYHVGQEWITKSGRVRPLGTPTSGSPLIGQVANASHPTEDAAGRPRPGSGNVLDTVGWLERANMGTLNTADADAGSSCLELVGPQVHEFELAVDATSTTINVKAEYESANYTLGTRPSMSVLNGEECGVSDATDTATASAADAYEPLSLTFTPSSKGIVTVRFENASSATAGVCRFDTFSVS